MATRKTHKARGASAPGKRQNGPATLEERLLRHKMTIDTGCWIWVGATNNQGYGQIGGVGTGKLMLTHRASYITFVGPIPDDELVLHKCDTRRCFNPNHLFLGSHRDNTEDMLSKGRGRPLYGEKHQFAYLTNQEVEEIRELYRTPEKKGRGYKSNAEELANKYGVTQGYIRDIVSRKWRATA